MNSNASRIARNHKVGVVGALLNHEPPPLTRNHGKDNRDHLREITRKKRDSKLEEARVKAAEQRPFKMKQFEGAVSRVYEERERPGSGGPSAGITPVLPKQDDFLRKADGKLVQPQLPDGCVGQRDRGVGPAKPPVPRAAEAPPRPAEVDKDFLRANRQAAVASRPGGGYPGKENRDDDVADRIKRIHGSGALRRDHTNVPAYLTERKEEMAEDQERKAREAKAFREKVPDGYRLIPEDERLETLESLETKKKELELAYSRLPMKIESEGQKKRQKDILDSIKEVEDASRLFSKQNVYVQL